MNITQQSTGNLTAMIKIEVIPEDYTNQVNNSLKEIQKKSALKGFRPGHAPIGLIKKMYEKGAIAEEVNKILYESLNNYIKDNKLQIIGYPLANMEKTQSPDFENETQLDFYFDIGLAPDFDLDLTALKGAEYFDVLVEDKEIDNYQEETRRNYGEFKVVDSIEEGDLINGEVTQLDENGNPAVQGIVKEVMISVKRLKDEDSRKEFIGKKKDDIVRFNPMKATGSDVDTAAMLEIKKEEAENLTSDFNFRIINCRRLEPAPLNEEFFNRVYPGGEIKELDQFRQRIAEEAKSVYQDECDKYFVHTTLEKLVNEIEFDLPSEFIKNWLVDSDKDLTLESVEQNINDYLKSLKHQLILNKISSVYQIRVGEQEVRDNIKNYFIRQYSFSPDDEEKSKYIDTVIESVLKNEKEVNRIHDQLFDEKLKILFKEKVVPEKKEVIYEEFLKVISEHHKIHHHEHK